MGEIVLLQFDKNGFGIEQHMKVDMPLNKVTEPNIYNLDLLLKTFYISKIQWFMHKNAGQYPVISAVK